MKIENNGVTITDVPGLDSIKIFSGGSILVDFGDFGDSCQEFSVEALAEFHQAIGAALQHARQMSGGEAETAPRVFERDSDEPGPNVIKVRDVDGDIWVRAGTKWQLERLTAWRNARLNAPLTEVRD